MSEKQDDEKNQKILGELIARAWAHDAFKARLLSDTMAVLKENGIDVPANVTVKAMANTDTLIHMVIPIKPASVELSKEMAEGNEQFKQTGKLISRAWSDEAFKKRLLSDTMAALKENNIDVPEGVTFKAVDNTDTLIHVVIPIKPASDELSDEELNKAAGGIRAAYGHCYTAHADYCHTF